MMKITKFGGKYKVIISAPQGCRATPDFIKKDEELINVVKHYFGIKHNQKKCPYCKDNG